jgi:hypothetical protein
VTPRYRRLARFRWPGGERPGLTEFVRKRSCFGAALAVRTLPLSTGAGSSCTARLTGVTGPIWWAHHRVVPVRSAIDRGERTAPSVPASLAARQASVSPRVLESTARTAQDRHRRTLIEDLILESETGELPDGVASANDEPQERNLGSARHDIR